LLVIWLIRYSYRLEKQAEPTRREAFGMLRDTSADEMPPETGS
jgi:hypothetical protein